jgi:hypothetical protein
MAKTQFLDYTIYLTDAALVQELQSVPHAGAAGSGSGAGSAVGRIIMAPTVAATTYSAPIQEESAEMLAPCIRSEWFTTGNNFPRDQRTFDRCNGGWFGICFLFGTTTHFYWRGKFAWMPKLDTTAPTGAVKSVMPQRRYIDGAELAASGTGGEGGSGNMSDIVCRAASRHLQGFGYWCDRQTFERVHVFNEAVPGHAQDSQGWDRFYFRLRKYPTAKQRIFKTSGTVSATSGIEIGVLANGQLVLTNIDNVGTETTFATATTPIALNRWIKLDVLFRYGNAIGGAGCHVFVNGVEVMSRDPYAGTDGLGQAIGIANCRLGTGATVHNEISVQFDDWIGADQVTNMTNGEDWNHGSKVACLVPKAFGSDNAASWLAAGDWRVLTQRRPITTPVTRLQNTTSGARLCVLTNADLEVDTEEGQLGTMGMVIGMYGFEAGAIGGNLGYRLPGGGAAVTTAVTQDGANYQWRSAYYVPSGLTNPVHPFAGTELVFDHGAAASAQNVAILCAAAETIGVFGPEDITPNAQSNNATPAPPMALAQQTAQYVADVKALLVAAGTPLNSNCGAHEITKRVAWGLRDAGAGLQIKTSGANCSGKAVAIIMFPSGRAVDILGDAGGANTPQWSEIAALDPALYALPENPGDDDALRSVPEHLGLHNAPYPRTPWAKRGTPPFSPVGLVTGTYVGNGTSASSFKELTFRFPVNFLIIRNTSTQTGIIWWSSLIGGHQDGGNEMKNNAPVAALIDPTFPGAPPAVDAQEQQTVVRITGNENSSNANGVTYQYTAFCDPAMRFCNAGALFTRNANIDFVTTLDNEGFTPDNVWLATELRGGGASGGIWYRGPGHTAQNASQLNTSETALAFSFAKGTITSKTALTNSAWHQVGYLAFRKNDGSGDANIGKVIATTSYTGDGNASRTVGILMGGQRPAWAMVVPHNAAAVIRDVSHTGTNSLTFPTTNNAATGITGGGIDSISVGSALNANGILYDVFVFPGGTTAGNAGFSTNGEFIVVAPDSPTGGDLFGGGLWDGTPPDPELNPDEPDGGGGAGTNPDLPDGQTGTDFQTSCIEATTFIINQALSHIGVSKQIGDITTELSEEATTSRLHYVDDISAVLRDHPWQFATRYARLVLVAGTSTVPVNGDWQYAYRAPDDMMFARRIVNPNLVGRDWDANPPKWRLGSDDTGLLIYTNETPTSGQPDNVTPQLEYTIRTTCAALQGDSIFREALAWRHAFSLAPALAKDDKKAAFCLNVYQAIKSTAATVGSKEVQQAHEGDVDWIEGRN